MLYPAALVLIKHSKQAGRGKSVGGLREKSAVIGAVCTVCTRCKPKVYLKKSRLKTPQERKAVGSMCTPCTHVVDGLCTKYVHAVCTTCVHDRAATVEEHIKTGE